MMRRTTHLTTHLAQAQPPFPLQALHRVSIVAELNGELTNHDSIRDTRPVAIEGCCLYIEQEVQTDVEILTLICRVRED